MFTLQFVPLFDALVSSFQAKYPNVRVERVPIADYGSSMTDVSSALTELMKHGQVDVVSIPDLEPLIADEVVLPLDPFIQSSQFDLKPFGMGVNQLRMDGKLYELPYQLHVVTLVYNTEMFRAAGLPTPRDGWTWEQFRESARKLTKGTEPDVWGLADARVLPALLARQISGSDDWMRDERAVKGGLQLLQTVLLDKSTPPYAVRADSRSGLSATEFQSGKAAMAIVSLKELTMSRNSDGVPWDIAPVPTLPGVHPKLEVSAGTYAIASGTKNPDLAWAFVRMLTGTEGATVVAKFGEVPAYITPTVKAAWFEREPSPPPGSQALFDAEYYYVNHGMGGPRWSIENKSLLQAWAKAVNQTALGERSLDEVLRDYQQAMTAPR